MPANAQSPLVHGSNPNESTKAHDALARDEVLWPRLQFRGIEPGGRGEFWEIRYCPCCGAAINREITLDKALVVLADETAVVHRTLGDLAPDGRIVSRKKEEARRILAALEKFRGTCGSRPVQIYGPYPPCNGRSLWRLQLYCCGHRRKISLSFPTRAEAEAMLPELQQRLRDEVPLRLHDAMEQYLEYKKASGLQPQSISSIRYRLFRFLPNNLEVSVFTPHTAEGIYLEYTKSLGRYGAIRAATHHAALRGVKEMWRWFVKRGLAKTNPFDAVEPIGRVNTGKPQLRETDARRLDELLFEQARKGDEGALALLVQVYLGLRSGEVMRLLVESVENGGEKVSILKGKSRNSKRSLELFPDVAKLLWAHCQGRPQTERVVAANLPGVPKGSWMYKRLHKHCKQAGLPLVCPNSLRGLHSSLALTNGQTSHAVAAQLGHASFSTTARHYADPSAVDNARIKGFVKKLRGDSGSLASTIKEMSAEEKQQLRALLAEDDNLSAR